mmetsp:Transcript_6230/g.9305  ORF Transcript_6230/g.9305 Transcript_6230/m.9305 type:complete len:86 (+) Transcript_6230:231-488(+)
MGAFGFTIPSRISSFMGSTTGYDSMGYFYIPRSPCSCVWWIMFTAGIESGPHFMACAFWSDTRTCNPFTPAQSKRPSDTKCIHPI